uniref:Uncharacterized protein n=1 Tax=Arundo donax TaxID=35708 RepID=A0A0A9FPR5_ARUDO
MSWYCSPKDSKQWVLFTDTVHEAEQTLFFRIRADPFWGFGLGLNTLILVPVHHTL